MKPVVGDFVLIQESEEHTEQKSLRKVDEENDTTEDSDKDIEAVEKGKIF